MQVKIVRIEEVNNKTKRSEKSLQEPRTPGIKELRVQVLQNVQRLSTEMQKKKGPNLVVDSSKVLGVNNNIFILKIKGKPE